MEHQGMLIWGLVFGSIGMGYVVYGKKQQHTIALISGIGLIIGPYMVGSLSLLLLAGVVLLVLPFVLKL